MIRTTLAVLAIAASTLCAADSEMLNLVPAGATVVAGIHVDRTLASPFGQLMMSHMRQDDEHFRKFIDATGFDPRRDLREVVLVSSDHTQKRGLVIARGVFNGAQILATAQKQSHGTITSYRGVSVLQFAAREPGMLAFLDGSLAIAGQEALVKAALDRRAGGPASPLAQRATNIDSSYDVWFVSSGLMKPPAVVQPGNAPSAPAAALAAIEQTTGGVAFGSLVRVNAEAVARSEKDAQALVDVVRFLASMMQLNHEKVPNFGPFEAALNSLQVTSALNTVKVSFSVPQADLEQLIRSKIRVNRASGNGPGF